MATPLRRVGAKTTNIGAGLPRAAESYAATVAVVISDHGPLSPRVLSQRAMETAPPHFAALARLELGAASSQSLSFRPWAICTCGEGRAVVDTSVVTADCVPV